MRRCLDFGHASFDSVSDSPCFSFMSSYWDDYHENGLPDSSVVFTIHNFGYGQAAIGEAAMYAQKFTTVSPSYSNEIRHEACIAPYSDKVREPHT